MKECLHDQLKLKTSKKLLAQICKSYPELEISEDEIYRSLVFAPNFQMGHLALPCFPFAKALKMAPPKIAQTLAETMGEEVKAVGPYLNIFFDSTELGELVAAPILAGDFFSKKLLEETPKTMLEYSQPNTHKELHVGHMRNLCLGDAVTRLHKYSGFDIVTATYPGDMGAHVAKTLWYLKNHCQEEAPQERKGAWLGTIYTKATLFVENETDEATKERYKTEMAHVLHEIEQGQGEYFDLWKTTREWSIDLMKEVYKLTGVEFDHWYFESDVDAESLNLVKKFYEKGIFVKDQGAIGADLKDEKLGFCLLVKSDGHGLYATKDLELARRKFENYGIENNIYIVDKRQALHFQQVFKILEKMGFPHAKDCYHLQYDFVELPDGAMSSRKGNIIPLQDLVDNMIELVENEHLHKYQETWTKEELEKVAHQVALGAIKFGMIRMDNNKKIVFDMKEWLKLDGESGPYIQYVHARINSLLQKGKEKLGDWATTPASWELLEADVEKETLLKLSDFNQVVINSCLNYKPSTLCSYLFDLSKLFNHFYASCPILSQENTQLGLARLKLAATVAKTLKQGLNLLGISAPERM